MEDDVLGFDVPVHYFLPVHVLDAGTDLFHEDGGLGLFELSLGFHQAVEGAVAKKLHQQVDVGCVIEHAI